MKRRFLKFTSVFLALNIFIEAFFPSIALALTSGPSQPEVQSFEPVGTSEMVDPFSGDFVYNIPLLDVGGYPVNISYHSGVSMDQESSWVGLGWNINPGVINRNMRGLPDDFDGKQSNPDKVTKELNFKPNRTYGVSGKITKEILGKEMDKLPKAATTDLTTKFNVSAGLGISYNNYTGFAIDQTMGLSVSASKSSKGTLTAGLGLNSSSSNGLSISPSVSYERMIKSRLEGDNILTSKSSLGIAASYNSRAGLKTLSLDFSTNSHVFNIGSKEKYQYNTPSSNGGSTITFGTPTYSPTVGTPMVTSSVAFSGKWTAHFLGVDAGYHLAGHYSEQKIDPSSRTQIVPAFGYFNTDRADKISMLDYNREKDGSFSLNTPALPLTNYTYDVYSVSGQGVGGMYRPYKGEVEYVYDRYTGSTSNSFSLGLEFGSGNMVKFGADIAISDVYTTTQPWIDDNPLIENIKHRNIPTSDPSYERFYFKQAGEKSVDAEYDLPTNFLTNSGDYHPVRVGLVYKGGYKVGTTNNLMKEKVEGGKVIEDPVPVTSEIYRKRRQKRNENISFLTVKEARNFGVQKDLYDEATSQDKRISSKAKDHHIGEISTLKADGSRYVYGIPAYNIRQQEVTFSAGIGVNANDNPKLDIAKETGLLKYTPGKENSMGNEHGLDNYFNRITTPAYAHSYLLTAVLAPDYVDNDGVPGPSSNDMGGYTKFNYTKINSNEVNYKWRVPVGTNTANGNEGLFSKDYDDQGNYIYGEKEVWYLESIENKNYIAVFQTGDRADGLGVEDDNGKIQENGERLKVLKNIVLYFRDEYLKGYNENTKSSTATPIKTVHFEYDYSLCQKLPNNILNVNPNHPSIRTNSEGLKTDQNDFVNQGGKLTLKRIYFTYQNSSRAKFSPYIFSYCDPDGNGEVNVEYNQDYNLKAYDRWGSYKPINGDFRNNSEFPYVDQDKASADIYASQWSLTKVDLPSGGYIKVDYEADDYGFVQDKAAMQMFKVAGIQHDAGGVGGDELYNGLGETSNDHKLFIAINVGNITTEEFQEKYLKGITDLYFRFRVAMGTADKEQYEYVPGYATIESSSVSQGIAYIKLKSISLKEKANKDFKINPITKAALQFCRLYTPEIAFGQGVATDSEFKQIFQSLLNSSFSKNIAETILGVNRSMMIKGYCKKVDLTKSVVRLMCPSQTKFGGGSRVKKLGINDKASAFSMGEDTEYSQVYSYTTIPEGKTIPISSGVASYEPLLGGDENPFRLPVAFLKERQEKLLIPDDRYYMEEPFGESFFPAPSVGYSKVTVSNVGRPGVKRHATGYVVHEFYTAKDFPVRTERTTLQTIPKKSPLALRLLKIQVNDYMNASQGFVVELNDMHGKPKAQWVYAEGKREPISGVEYKYKTDGTRLNNEIAVINTKGEVKAANVGVDSDMVLDMREQETEATSVGLHGNLAAFLAAIFPTAVPLILPAYSKERTRFRSVVATKVIQRYGILEQTIAYDLGSKVSTRNIAFDSETGEVLLTETKNDFEDPVYNFTYPAHWAYDRMGQAYRNTGLVQTLNFSFGVAPVNDPSLFVEGDEVMILENEEMDNNSSSQEIKDHKKYRFWIVKNDGNNIVMMGGNPLTGAEYLPHGNTKFRIIRSGRRNLQNVPVGTVVSLINPIQGEGNTYKNIDFDLSNHKVLAAGSSIFLDEWNILCAAQYCSTSSGNTPQNPACVASPGGNSSPAVSSYNPYFAGSKGIWRLKKTYTFLTNREQTPTMANTRKDGAFTSYSSFWNAPSQEFTPWIKDETNWRWVTEITSYDPYGSTEIENKDALERFSAARTGYNHSVPTGVSSNSKHSEMFVDNFEHTTDDACTDNFSINNKNNVNLNYSHTGRKSIKVGKDGNNVTLTIIKQCEQ